MRCPLPTCVSKSSFKRPTQLARHLVLRCPDARADLILRRTTALVSSRHTMASLEVTQCPTCGTSLDDCSWSAAWSFLGHLCEGHPLHLYDQLTLNQLCSVAARCCAAGTTATHSSCAPMFTLFLSERHWHVSSCTLNDASPSIVLCEDPQLQREQSKTLSSSVIFMPVLRCSTSEKDALFFACHLLSLIAVTGLDGPKKSPLSIEVVSSEGGAVASLAQIFAGQLLVTSRLVK